jgi:preprotein translocase subunit SecA
VPPLLTQEKEEKGEGDYWVDEKAHHGAAVRAGARARRGDPVRLGLLPEGRSLYEPGNILLMHHLYAALRAHSLFHRDQHYVCRTAKSSSSTSSPAA